MTRLGWGTDKSGAAAQGETHGLYLMAPPGWQESTASLTDTILLACRKPFPHLSLLRWLHPTLWLELVAVTMLSLPSLTALSL